MATPPTDLERRLGYTFTDPAHLQLAVTHCSYAAQSNSQLGFLGDRVLGLVVAAALCSRFPSEDQGQLTRWHSRLTDNATLARLARGARLHEDLRMGLGAVTVGDAQRESVLAGALEAVIAATVGPRYSHTPGEPHTHAGSEVIPQSSYLHGANA